MKKKFLSLMMAAAVVATTSVSAFAADNNVHVTMPNKENVTAKDNEEPIQEVEITGHVQNNKGEMPAATFKVTVPTAANFTVTNQGQLVGPDLTIKNEGPQSVDVLAYNFSNTGSGAIKVAGEDVVTTGNGADVPRSTVSLRLSVDGVAKAYLGADSEHSKRGVYDNQNLENLQANGVKLLSLDPGADQPQEKRIKIEGTAGKNPTLANPVSDTFKLVLKIKKTPVS